MGSGGLILEIAVRGEAKWKSLISAWDTSFLATTQTSALLACAAISRRPARCSFTHVSGPHLGRGVQQRRRIDLRKIISGGVNAAEETRLMMSDNH